MDVNAASTLPVTTGQTDRTLNVACRMLLRAGGPVAVTDLAAELGTELAELKALITEYEHLGRMKRDGDRVVASLGLSAVPSEYEIRFGGQRMWAWCAKSALGIVSALGLGGSVAGRSPLTGSALTISLGQAGRPGGDLAVFWPADTLRDSCGSAELEYCPAFAILEDRPSARAWARERGFPGEVLTTAEAVARATAYYAPIVDVEGEGSDLTARISAEPEG